MACKRCSQEHFNFVKCEDHAAKLAEEKRKERAPEAFYRTPSAGNRLYASEVNPADPNIVYIPRKQHPLYKEP